MSDDSAPIKLDDDEIAAIEDRVHCRECHAPMLIGDSDCLQAGDRAICCGCAERVLAQHYGEMTPP